MRAPVAKYFVIKHILEARLERESEAGARLPSEAELCEEFAVSRITVQQALRLLEREGIIRREQGRGTFYLGPRPHRTETRPSELLERVVKQREGSFNRVVGRLTIRATPRIATRLEVPRDSPVDVIDRVTFVDHEPLAFVTAYLPRALGAKLADAEAELARSTIGSFLKDRHGIEIGSVRQTIGAGLADPSYAEALGIEPGAPVLEGERIYLDEADRPLFYSHAFYRADRHRFLVSLKEWR